MKTLEKLFHEQIQDLYSGETQILEALPNMIEAASDRDLGGALESHLQETRRQKGRLKEIAEDLGIELNGVTCKGMQGILEEGTELVEDEAESADVRDAAIITACQRVEHYEIAGYGSARTYARMLGRDSAATALEETLQEEKGADQKLTEIAESRVNQKSMN